MTKIQTIEEFRRIKDAEFGFIITSNGTNTLHQSNCNNLTDEGFARSDHYWFATISLAERSFDVVICEACKPE